MSQIGHAVSDGLEPQVGESWANTKNVMFSKLDTVAAATKVKDMALKKRMCRRHWTVQSRKAVHRKGV